MVNLDDVANFQVVLDDFFLPSLNRDDLPSPIPVLCPPINVDIWRGWAAKHIISLVFLSRDSCDLNPCDILWRRIFHRARSIKYANKKQLLEEIANAFDFVTLHGSVQFPAALSMSERMEKLERAAGGPIH